MFAEIGLFSLVVAGIFSLLQVFVPWVGLKRNDLSWQLMVNRAVWGQTIFVAMAYVSLTICFLQNDFTVIYVLANSSRLLPWFYKLCAVWGGHEGSMLLWVFILTSWTLAVSLMSKSLPSEMRVRVLVVLGALSVGFILFLLTTSNPFLRQFQLLNSEGRDLNPLLQDPGFLFHPPMLYMGYVGFSVPFAFAIASLWLGRTEAHWAKWTRPWTLAAWCCLTAGITLGSWWAYRELGWGGWWFWDPVENASFMPWLVGTALIHSLVVNEQRQQFKAWTLLLAITAFSLSLIGTFLVRSGILTSVHAFAVDPSRGLFILIYLFVVIGGALILFGFRADALVAKNKPYFISRESALFLNNLFLFVAMLTVLLGTIYPLLIDGLGLGKLSVGAPYFNSVFVPLMLPLFLLMGVAIHLKWQQDDIKAVLKRLCGLFFLSFICPLVLLYFFTQTIHLSVYFGLVLSFWIFFTTLKALWLKIKMRGFRQLNLAFCGMIIAHCGVAVTVIGVAVSTGYGVQNDFKMAPGETIPFAGFKIAFVRETSLQGPNYHGSEVQFKITSPHRTLMIYPQKRIYNVGKMAMTESAIDVTLFRDIYVALGEPLNATAWSVRLYYKPFIRWIWGGGFMILAGGLFALLDRRFFSAQR